MTLSRQRIVVTGANGNLGRAVAERAVSLGAEVALLDRTFDAALQRSPGERMSCYEVDLLDAAATRACFERLGRTDALCNVAGGFAAGQPVHETDEAVFERMFDLNVRTLLNSVRAVVPGMLVNGRGKIINVGAIAALKGQASMGAYCAAKAVVLRLTESLAAELRDHGINVNCVLPSIIDTPQNRAAMPQADPSAWVSPADLASVICYLASDAAGALHGAAIPVTNRV